MTSRNVVYWPIADSCSRDSGRERLCVSLVAVRVRSNKHANTRCMTMTQLLFDQNDNAARAGIVFVDALQDVVADLVERVIVCVVITGT